MIALAADHGGYQLKEEVKKWLDEENIAYKDFGTLEEMACDYADVALPACDAVVSGECEKALLFCGTGIGISMAANKVKGIRAACCSLHGRACCRARTCSRIGGCFPSHGI